MLDHRVDIDVGRRGEPFPSRQVASEHRHLDEVRTRPLRRVDDGEVGQYQPIIDGAPRRRVHHDRMQAVTRGCVDHDRARLDAGPPPEQERLGVDRPKEDRLAIAEVDEERLERASGELARPRHLREWGIQLDPPVVHLRYLDRDGQDLLPGGLHPVGLSSVLLHHRDDLILGPAALPAAHTGDFLHRLLPVSGRGGLRRHRPRIPTGRRDHETTREEAPPLLVHRRRLSVRKTRVSER